MQYLLTEDELQKIKQDAEVRGYKIAENLLEQILKKTEEDAGFYISNPKELVVHNASGEATSIFDEANKENTFRKLLERL